MRFSTFNAAAPVATFALLGALASAPASAVTLYDPGLGTLPAAQGWVPLVVGTGATQAIVGGRLRTDTATDVNALVQVNALASPVPLDTVGGFTLHFGLQVVSEAHQSSNRAGYSVLVQGADPTQGIELSFWEDRVWALDYDAGGADSGYVHGADGLLDTIASFIDYSLTVQNNQFTLLADGNLLLQGAMVNYAVQGLSTAPYGSSSALYFGDNSSRGQSVVDLGLVSVSAVPEPGVAALWLAGLGALAWRRRPAGAGRGAQR